MPNFNQQGGERNVSMSIGNNYSSLFSSLNGKYNAANDMAALSAQRSQITSGSYGKLMKAYVGKVGNKAALDAYRSTGTTVNSATEISGSSATSAASSATSKYAVGSKAAKYAAYKSDYLDNHLSSIAKTKQSSTTAAGKSFLDKHLAANEGEKQNGIQRAIAYAEATTGIKNPVTYNGNAAVQTAADPSVAIDASV